MFRRFPFTHLTSKKKKKTLRRTTPYCHDMSIYQPTWTSSAKDPQSLNKTTSFRDGFHWTHFNADEISWNCSIFQVPSQSLLITITCRLLRLSPLNLSFWLLESRFVDFDDVYEVFDYSCFVRQKSITVSWSWKVEPFLDSFRFRYVVFDCA